MWSVIVEYENSKILDKQNDTSLKEYRIHPILSAYFGISPRKKRKRELSLDDIKTIFFGTEEAYFQLYKQISSDKTSENNSSSSINKTTRQQTFSELFDDNI